MSFKQPYTTSIRNVGSYQSSGRPWCQGGINATSVQQIDFPFVTRWVCIINNHATQDLKVGFSEDGVGGTNYFTVPAAGTTTTPGPASSIRLELKCASIYLLGSSEVDVVAGLTNIPRDQMPSLAGESGIG